MYKGSNEYFSKKGHLNTKGMVLWIRYQQQGIENVLPKEITQHIRSCSQCRAEASQLKRKLGK